MEQNEIRAAKGGKAKRTRPERRRVRLGPADLTLVIVILILLGIGVIMMFSASYAIAINEGNPGHFYGLRQGVFAMVGLVVMFIVSFIDYHIFQKAWIALGSYAGSVILLILVLLIGTDLGTGCQRWIDLGPMTFQPSEIAKFAVVILFAYTIDQNATRMKTIKTGILPYLVLLGIIAALLMKQPHLSCTLLICMIGVSMIYVGGARYSHLFLLVIVGVLALAAVVAYKMVVEDVDYFGTRLNTWLDPFGSEDESGTWQTRQSLIAIGSGGLFGMGLGESRQKYLYLPESENDFVFAIVCEELGFVGAVTVILLFVMLVVLGFHIAAKAKDRFGMLVAVGFTVQIGIQAFLNIAVVSGLVPNTGISLPFFSYGGTALMMQLAQMGILLNISRARYVVESKKKKEEPAPDPEPEFLLDA